jgi:hypothetical protein
MATFRQPDLFGPGHGAADSAQTSGQARLPLGSDLLLTWQRRVAQHQAELAAFSEQGPSGQLALPTEPTAADSTAAESTALDPFSLTPQNLDVWRWPHAPQQGAAIYFVVDRPPHLATPLLLYVGETGRADRRWKGEHDCKHYLAAYSEALRRVELTARLSIRFWCDVPAAIRGRRALEQALIRRWLPPFNKETRERWVTPFTADPA